MTESYGILIPRPSLRVYDSPTTRVLEELLALRWDLSFVHHWLQELIPFIETTFGREEMEEDLDEPETTIYFKGFWDATIVALFRHYKFAPQGRILSLYGDVLSKLGPEFVEWFESLELQRDRKVVHPIGHTEGHMVTVDLDDSPPRVEPHSFLLMGMTERDGTFLPAFVKELLKNVQSRIDVQTELVRAEVATLSDEHLQRLPPAYMHAHGRRFGS